VKSRHDDHRIPESERFDRATAGAWRAVEHLTKAERAARGKAARAEVSRPSHA
jgi:hypothetical protein